MEKEKIQPVQNRVLITGATGFVGANLARRLLKEGYDVHLTTRSTSNKWRIADILPKVKEHVIDLRDLEELRVIIEEVRPEIILHLATAGVYGGKHLPERDVIDINFIGTFNLINACDNIDYKCLILTGSSAEYGPKDEPMKERDVCEPVNMYGITKLASTRYGNYIAKLKDKPIVSLRIFSPFGPYDDSSRLMTYAITSAFKGKDLYLANPESVRDYIFVDEVVRIYLAIIRNADKLKGKTFNAGSGKETKISYVVEKIIELTGSKSKVFWNKAEPRKFDAKHWQADMGRSKEELDFELKTDIDEGLKKTVEWFKENLDLYDSEEK